jgi:ketosteroid isomerase-like protein
MAKKKLEEIYVDHTAQVFCFRKGYRVYPQPCKGGYQIFVELADKKVVINATYTDKEVYNEIWKIYTKLKRKNENS